MALVILGSDGRMDDKSGNGWKEVVLGDTIRNENKNYMLRTDPLSPVWGPELVHSSPPRLTITRVCTFACPSKQPSGFVSFD